MLLSVSQGDWLASFDLREAYLPVPVHPASRPFLRFLLRDTVYQFQTLLWPLHDSAGLHLGHGSCFSYTPFSGYPYASIPRHLAVQSSSQESLLEVLLTVLRLCHDLGIVIHPRNSNLIPSQVVQYLWVVIDSTSFRASPSVERISRLRFTTAVFLSCASPTASLWLSLLGVLS